jgi:hypothetical protein
MVLLGWWLPDSSRLEEGFQVVIYNHPLDIQKKCSARIKKSVCVNIYEEIAMNECRSHQQAY